MTRNISFSIAVFLALPLFAQESREGSVDRNKDLPQIVREISEQVSRATPEGKRGLVVWLVDNASVLKSSGQGKILSDLIVQNFSDKEEIHHSLYVLGDPTQGLIAPTKEISRITTAFDALLKEAPDNRIKNCLLGVRIAGKGVSSFRGSRFVVLVTSSNGDNEDQLEETLRFLQKLRVRFFSIAGEAVYSDPYWKSVLAGVSSYSSETDKFRRLKFDLAGQESAYIEFPYGWPLMSTDPSYTVPPGFGYYALSRLAVGTGGTYYVYNSGSSASTFCQSHACSICSGQHQQCGAHFQSTKLTMTAPDLRARDLVRRDYGRQPVAIAQHRAWVTLQKKGVLRGASQLKLSGKRFREVRSQMGSSSSLIAAGGSWKARKGQALRQVKEIKAVLAQFLPVLEKFGPDADLRVGATADAFHLHLKMLLFNLKQFAYFCEEMNRISRTKSVPRKEFGGRRLDQYIGKRISGYSYRNLYLCHGGTPYRGMTFLGGDRVGEEQREILDLADQLIDRHRSTPWEVLVRRSAFALFTPIIQAGTAKQKKRPKPESSGSGDEQTATPNPNRPPRPGAGGSGSGGTATGD